MLLDLCLQLYLAVKSEFRSENILILILILIYVRSMSLCLTQNIAYISPLKKNIIHIM